MTAHKAIVAAVVGFIGPVLVYLASWLSSPDPWSWRSFLSAVIGSALTSLVAGGGTYAVPNQPKHVAEHTAAAVALDNAHSTNMEG